MCVRFANFLFSLVSGVEKGSKTSLGRHVNTFVQKQEKLLVCKCLGRANVLLFPQRKGATFDLQKKVKKFSQKYFLMFFLLKIFDFGKRPTIYFY